MKTKPLALGLVAGLAIGAQALAETPQPPRAAPPAARAVPPGAPASFADIVQRVAPAVVAVETRRRAPVQPPVAFPGLPFDFFGLPSPEGQNPFQRGPVLPQRPQERTIEAAGSGFFISADGYLVTNNHVVEGATEITVTLPDKRELKATVVGRDEPTDIAVLKVEGRGFPFVNFSNAATPRVGDWVVAVGNPFGLGGTATAGIVSAYGREVGSTFVDYIQIDAAINRGNSGGPTFDASGRVIGVNTMIYSPTGGSVGIGFAIPAYIADDIVRRLIQDGRIERGYIGASIQNLNADMAEGLNLDRRDGALVTALTPGAPAARAGLEIGDVVTTVNGRSIENASQLTRQIAATRPGQNVTLGVIRNGQNRTVSVRTDTRPAEQALAGDRPGAASPNTRLGLTVRPLDEAARRQNGLEPEVRGVVIESVEAGSDAQARGLRAGDVITRANERAITAPADLAAAVEAVRAAGRNSILLFINRAGRSQAVPVRLTEPAAGGPVN